MSIYRLLDIFSWLVFTGAFCASVGYYGNGDIPRATYWLVVCCAMGTWMNQVDRE